MSEYFKVFKIIPKYATLSQLRASQIPTLHSLREAYPLEMDVHCAIEPALLFPVGTKIAYHTSNMDDGGT